MGDLVCIKHSYIDLYVWLLFRKSNFHCQKKLFRQYILLARTYGRLYFKILQTIYVKSVRCIFQILHYISGSKQRTNDENSCIVYMKVQVYQILLCDSMFLK